MEKIGIILDQTVIQRALRGKPTYEKLEYYSSLGKQLEVQPVFFHPTDVNLRTRTIKGYVWNGSKLVPRKISLPAVMHNRLLSGDRRVNGIIRQLSKIGKVYNGIINRNKVLVQQQLWMNASLRPYLPETELYSRSAIQTFLKKYPILYVKPLIGSIGNGVLRIEASSDGCKFTSANGQKTVSNQVIQREVAAWVNGKRFLVQQGILLAKHEDQTFDIRVSVQKNGEQIWRITGMVAKVANPKNKLSNLAQGGAAVQLSEILYKLFDTSKVDIVEQKLRSVSIEIAKQFEQFHPTLADVGLDMGIDSEGNPSLIEVNVRDQRYSFYKAGELEMFKNTYWNPLAYGKSLL